MFVFHASASKRVHASRISRPVSLAFFVACLAAIAAPRPHSSTFVSACFPPRRIRRGIFDLLFEDDCEKWAQRGGT